MFTLPVLPSRVQRYVVAVTLVSAPAMAWAVTVREPLQDLWGPVLFALLALLLENRSTALRQGGGTGNLSFIATLAALLLFGAFWGAAVAASSTFVSQCYLRRPCAKVIFNASQKALSALAAGATYTLLGGTVEPVFFHYGLTAALNRVLLDAAAFVAAAAVFFAANSLLVSAAVAFDTGRRLTAIWRANSLWVLRYDLSVAGLAVVLGWLYAVLDHPSHEVARLAFPAMVLPLVGARRVYLRLNSLQHLHEALAEAHVQLEENVREGLELMVKSIEARDPYTSGHSRRVAALAEIIATDYGLAAPLVDGIRHAALLHDVGKIHAEFAPILSKEGKLTAEEWAVMQTHPARSAELVGLFGKFRGIVQDAVLHHHERWDGAGYPVRRAGEEIPIGARIIAIADTIDAMSTDRPYRKAPGMEAVLAELVRERGRQFDPDLVDCAVHSVSLKQLMLEWRDLAVPATPSLATIRRVPRESWSNLGDSVGPPRHAALG